MKAFYRTILVVITGILLQSCTKTYEIQFDKLLLLTFHEEFKCPKYLENCCITIKTKDNLDTIEYISDAIIAAKNSDLPEYQYIEATNEKTIGELIIPSVKSCNITIYNNENDKILELTYKDKANLPTPTSDTGITNLTTWENSNLKCNVEGDISWDYESYPGCWRFYSGKYKLYGCNQTILKEITTEHCTENENCLLKKTTIEYYPTGNIYHKILEKHVDTANEECTECTHSVEIIEDSYYNEDGSEISYKKENTESYSYQEENNYEYEEDYTTNNKNQSSNKPSWLIGSWRTPLGDTGALIVNVNRDDANVWIMNGVSLVNRIDYEDWTVFDDMLYLINDGERLIDSPSFFIDYNNRTIIGHTGERFEKHY